MKFYGENKSVKSKKLFRVILSWSTFHIIVILKSYHIVDSLKNYADSKTIHKPPSNFSFFIDIKNYGADLNCVGPGKQKNIIFFKFYVKNPCAETALFRQG
jgi:hypothetical protein